MAANLLKYAPHALKLLQELQPDDHTPQSTPSEERHELAHAFLNHQSHLNPWGTSGTSTGTAPSSYAFGGTSTGTGAHAASFMTPQPLDPSLPSNIGFYTPPQQSSSSPMMMTGTSTGSGMYFSSPPPLPPPVPPHLQMMVPGSYTLEAPGSHLSYIMPPSLPPFHPERTPQAMVVSPPPPQPVALAPQSAGNYVAASGISTTAGHPSPPTDGALTPQETEQLRETLRSIADAHCTIVDHHVRMKQMIAQLGRHTRKTQQRRGIRAAHGTGHAEQEDTVPATSLLGMQVSTVDMATHTPPPVDQSAETVQELQQQVNMLRREVHELRLLCTHFRPGSCHNPQHTVEYGGKSGSKNKPTSQHSNTCDDDQDTCTNTYTCTDTTSTGAQTHADEDDARNEREAEQEEDEQDNIRTTSSGSSNDSSEVHKPRKASRRTSRYGRTKNSRYGNRSRHSSSRRSSTIDERSSAQTSTTAATSSFEYDDGSEEDDEMETANQDHGPSCDVCKEVVANVYCPSCKYHLCTRNECDAEIHNDASTKHHVRHAV